MGFAEGFAIGANIRTQRERTKLMQRQQDNADEVHNARMNEYRYQEEQRRNANYTKSFAADVDGRMNRMGREADAITDQINALVEQGTPEDDPLFQSLVQKEAYYTERASTPMIVANEALQHMVNTIPGFAMHVQNTLGLDGFYDPRNTKGNRASTGLGGIHMGPGPDGALSAIPLVAMDDGSLPPMTEDRTDRPNDKIKIVKMSEGMINTLLPGAMEHPIFMSQYVTDAYNRTTRVADDSEVQRERMVAGSATQPQPSDLPPTPSAATSQGDGTLPPDPRAGSGLSEEPGVIEGMLDTGSDILDMPVSDALSAGVDAVSGFGETDQDGIFRADSQPDTTPWLTDEGRRGVRGDVYLRLNTEEMATDIVEAGYSLGEGVAAAYQFIAPAFMGGNDGFTLSKDETTKAVGEAKSPATPQISEASDLPTTQGEVNETLGDAITKARPDNITTTGDALSLALSSPEVTTPDARQAVGSQIVSRSNASPWRATHKDAAFVGIAMRSGMMTGPEGLNYIMSGKIAPDRVQNIGGGVLVHLDAQSGNVTGTTQLGAAGMSQKEKYETASAYLDFEKSRYDFTETMKNDAIQEQQDRFQALYDTIDQIITDPEEAAAMKAVGLSVMGGDRNFDPQVQANLIPNIGLATQNAEKYAADNTGFLGTGMFDDSANSELTKQLTSEATFRAMAVGISEYGEVESYIEGNKVSAGRDGASGFANILAGFIDPNTGGGFSPAFISSMLNEHAETAVRLFAQNDGTKRGVDGLAYGYDMAQASSDAIVVVLKKINDDRAKKGLPLIQEDLIKQYSATE